jgi:hypothetical protein
MNDKQCSQSLFPLAVGLYPPELKPWYARALLQRNWCARLLPGEHCPRHCRAHLERTAGQVAGRGIGAWIAELRREAGRHLERRNRPAPRQLPSTTLAELLEVKP